MTSGLETERVYSYNPGARTGRAKTEVAKAESGGGVLVEGQQPLPTMQLGVLGERSELPQRGSGLSPDRRLFSPLRMASPDTVILLILWTICHAAIGGPRAPPPLVYVPV